MVQFPLSTRPSRIGVRTLLLVPHDLELLLLVQRGLELIFCQYAKHINR
jgi:hypothetical protein